ncbi:MAG: DUF72 domain-containing protein [Wenzhouxiangellaceae bacterium]|nr:DUF72 domain-containing protein [Wenzhouxiangellaceae bacterium]
MSPAEDTRRGSKPARCGRLLAGTSGWSYPDWKGSFYPQSVPQRKFLEYYTTRFPATELNASFYRLPTQKTIAGWLERTPARFRFCVKLSRLITHFKRLVDCDGAIAGFVDRLAPLAERMGPVLAQLPASVAFDAGRVAGFLQDWQRHASWALAIEARHPSWLEPAARQMLVENGAIPVRADSGGRWPSAEVAVEGDVYLRFHGPEELYSSGYTPQKLGVEARRIAGWLKQGRSVWAFFNNTDGGDAWRDAEKLIELIGKRLPASP